MAKGLTTLKDSKTGATKKPRLTEDERIAGTNRVKVEFGKRLKGLFPSAK
jgi:hypothetical protein